MLKALEASLYGMLQGRDLILTVGILLLVAAIAMQWIKPKRKHRWCDICHCYHGTIHIPWWVRRQ